MGYTASFKTRAEREIIELARSLTNLSQGAYTRAVLLKEAYQIVRRAQELAKTETEDEHVQSDVGGVVAEAPGGVSTDSDALADTQANATNTGTV